MNNDFQRELTTKVDRMLTLIAAGKIAADRIELLGAAVTLRKHGELELAERCEAAARRLPPNLARHLD